MESPVAIVTGGARRIGAEISRTLHTAGMRVVVHCNHSTAEADALCADLNGMRAGSAARMQADLCDLAQLESLAADAAAKWDRLDLLVNNASTFYPTALGSVTEQDWDDLVGTNMKAPFFLAQALAPALRASRGNIVNLVDVHAMRPMKGHPVYSAAKAGLAMLTRALARELGPEVRVNGVAPGAVLWPEDGIDEAAQRGILESTALKRRGEPGDVAEAVRYLALEAGFVTGQVIAVDGGRSIGWD